MPLRHEARWNDWRLDELLQSATFPVYGLLGTPFGLILSGLGISGTPAEYFSLELNFGIPGVSDDRRGVRLSSSSLSEWSLPHKDRVFKETEGERTARRVVLLR